MKVTTGQVTLSFNSSTGALTSYQINNQEQLLAPVRPNFWRAMTDNDMGNRLNERSAFWRDAHATSRLIRFEHHADEQGILVTTDYTWDQHPGCTLSITYRIDADGVLEISQTLIPGVGLPDLPEFGMLLQLNNRLDTISWYGRGPHDNYADRLTSARLGYYTGAVRDQFVPYLKPQECGNKTDVRFAEITSANGQLGLHVEATIPFEINALPWTPEELEANDHVYKLPQSTQTVARINYKQMGVGGDDSWSARTHVEYTLPANRAYHFTFTVRPV